MSIIFLFLGGIGGVLYVLLVRSLISTPGMENHKILIFSLLSLITIMVTTIVPHIIKESDNQMWLGFGYGLAMFMTPIYFAMNAHSTPDSKSK